MALAAFVGGMAILVTDTPLRHLCRTNCWLNDFLFAILGEARGKKALGALWFLAALLLVGLALYMTKRGFGKK